jgi:lipopolysaccharide assembly outer membrane protein LptD (OstA)
MIYTKHTLSFKWYLSIELLLLSWLIFPSHTLVHAEKISIKGLDIHYNEHKQEMVASGNAELIHPEFKIFADTIIYNQKDNLITGKNNIEMIQKNQVILSDTFLYDTKKNILSIENLNVEFTTKNKNQQIFVNSKSFSDYNTYKSGKKAIISTCETDPPHYYLKADAFTIYPEKRIIGQNVTLVNPVFFIPLGFWSPAYIFELGKRKVIYLMPVFGSNKVEGGFFKSQIDYVLNDNWTGTAYLDYMSKKGIGMGTRLNYNNYDNIDSDVYYYGVTGDDSNIKEWNQTVKLDDQRTLTTHIQDKNMYLIHGGNTKTDKHTISYENKADDATHKTVYSFNQSKFSSSSPKNYHLSYSKRGDDNSSLTTSYRKSESSINTDDINLSSTQKIGHDITMKNTHAYYQKDISSTDKRKDSYLKTKNTLSKTFKDFGTLDTTIDYYFDTDKDNYTEDNTNHIVQKVPELNLALNRFKLNKEWSLNQTFQYGNYSESYYISSLKKQRDYTQSRVKMDQTLSGIYNYDFLDGKLNISSTYDQYYYASGDQAYTLSLNSSYSNDILSFFKTDTSHSRTWSPKEGNSPFYFDAYDQQERNELRETLTLYYKSPSKYALTFSTGYNWIINYQLDHRYRLLINPNRKYRATFSTTYLLRQHKYTTLSSQFSYTPSKMFETSIQANYDLNEGEMINLNHTLTGISSRKWQNRWIYSAYFTYSPKYKQDYQLQTLSLTKDLHRRQLTIMYNRILEEYRFQFTINAFPESKLGFKSNKYESFRLEGVFDDSSIQR